MFGSLKCKGFAGRGGVGITCSNHSSCSVTLYPWHTVWGREHPVCRGTHWSWLLFQDCGTGIECAAIDTKACRHAWLAARSLLVTLWQRVCCFWLGCFIRLYIMSTCVWSVMWWLWV